MRFKAGDRVSYVSTAPEKLSTAAEIGCKATVRDPAYTRSGGVRWLNIQWDEHDPKWHEQSHGRYHEESFDLLKEEDMPKELDLTKPVQTKSGKKVRILCTDRVGDKPVAGLIETTDGMEKLSSWTLEGRKSLYYGTDAYDLVNVPEEVTLWFNVYKDASSGEVYTHSSHPSKEKAEVAAAPDRVTCVSITIPL